MHSVLLNHYYSGASYPCGGASEIAFNIIPVIERSGGKVMVRAEVESILHNGDKVIGVSVKKGIVKYSVETTQEIGIYSAFTSFELCD